MGGPGSQAKGSDGSLIVAGAKGCGHRQRGGAGKKLVCADLLIEGGGCPMF